jgi:hypothetical protein
LELALVDELEHDNVAHPVSPYHQYEQQQAS